MKNTPLSMKWKTFSKNKHSGFTINWIFLQNLLYHKNLRTLSLLVWHTRKRTLHCLLNINFLVNDSSVFFLLNFSFRFRDNVKKKLKNHCEKIKFEDKKIKISDVEFSFFRDLWIIHFYFRCYHITNNFFIIFCYYLCYNTCYWSKISFWQYSTLLIIQSIGQNIQS